MRRLCARSALSALKVTAAGLRGRWATLSQQILNQHKRACWKIKIEQPIPGEIFKDIPLGDYRNKGDSPRG